MLVLRAWVKVQARRRCRITRLGPNDHSERFTLKIGSIAEENPYVGSGSPQSDIFTGHPR